MGGGGGARKFISLLLSLLSGESKTLNIGNCLIHNFFLAVALRTISWYMNRVKAIFHFMQICK